MPADRLNPKRSSPRYVHLTQLKKTTLEFLQEIATKESVLIDFGCGDMPYRTVIEPQVGRYVGVDLAENNLAEVKIGFDSKTELADATADIVLSNQVLEHVDSPSGYLAEAWRILKPGGSLLLSTHGYWLYHPTPNDYWRWTSAGLKKTVEEQHFLISRWKGIMGLTAAGVQLLQDGVYFKLPSFTKSSFSFLMQIAVGLADRLHSQSQRNRDASLYVIVAQKV